MSGMVFMTLLCRRLLRWTPKIFEHWTSGSCESSMSIFRWVLSWCVSEVNKVTDEFGAEINREFSFR